MLEKRTSVVMKENASNNKKIKNKKKQPKKHATGPKRHAMFPNKEPLRGITGPVIQRMARRGGVKRLSAKVHESTRESIYRFLKDALFDAIECAKYAKRKTLTDGDVRYAFKRQGRSLYSFE